MRQKSHQLAWTTLAVITKENISSVLIRKHSFWVATTKKINDVTLSRKKINDVTLSRSGQT